MRVKLVRYYTLTKIILLVTSIIVAAFLTFITLVTFVTFSLPLFRQKKTLNDCVFPMVSKRSHFNFIILKRALVCLGSLRHKCRWAGGLGRHRLIGGIVDCRQVRQSRSGSHARQPWKIRGNGRAPPGSVQFAACNSQIPIPIYYATQYIPPQPHTTRQSSPHLFPPCQSTPLNQNNLTLPSTNPSPIATLSLYTTHTTTI